MQLPTEREPSVDLMEEDDASIDLASCCGMHNPPHATGDDISVDLGNEPSGVSDNNAADDIPPPEYTSDDPDTTAPVSYAEFPDPKTEEPSADDVELQWTTAWARREAWFAAATDDLRNQHEEQIRMHTQQYRGYIDQLEAELGTLRQQAHLEALARARCFDLLACHAALRVQHALDGKLKVVPHGDCDVRDASV